jgi:O-antigen ligase
MRSVNILIPTFQELGKILLYSIFILIPFAILPFKVNGSVLDMRLVREIMFLSAATIILVFLQDNRWLRLFIFWVILNWWLTLFFPEDSFRGVTNITAALIIYVGLKHLLKSRMFNPKVIMNIILCSCLFQFSWAIMQKFNYDPIFYPMPYVSGWTGNISLFAVFFPVVSFLFLYYWRFKKIPILFFIFLISLFMVKSFTALFCYFATGLFYIFVKFKLSRKMILLTSLSIIVLICFGEFYKHPNFDRLSIWRDMFFGKFKSSWFIGHGVNSFQVAGVKLGSVSVIEAHNDYLQILFEYGLIGLVLFLGFIVSIYIKFFKSRKTDLQLILICGITAYLVSAISIFPMHLAQLSIYAITFLVILEDTYNGEGDV